MPTKDSIHPSIDATVEEPGAVAARCRHLAAQLAGGPVRDALLEMARDYTGRAVDAARTAPFRLELERSQSDATALRLFEAFDRFVDNVRRAVAPMAPPPAPIVRRAVTAPVAPVATAPVATAKPAASPKRVSRLYRIHALQR